jgi:hypothetical protein
MCKSSHAFGHSKREIAKLQTHPIKKSKGLSVVRQLTIAIAITVLGLLSGCMATTMITTTPPGGTVHISSSDQTTTPRTETYPTRTFGNLEFRAQAPNQESLFGIVPLKFNGGYLALNILFFAPASFFNLREVYSFYDFDLEKKVVKYKRNENDEWTVYTPTPAESNRGLEVYKDK